MCIKNDALPLEDEATMLPQNTGNWYPIIKCHIPDKQYQQVLQEPQHSQMSHNVGALACIWDISLMCWTYMYNVKWTSEKVSIKLLLKSDWNI
jgi:hypothetical protein